MKVKRIKNKREERVMYLYGRLNERSKAVIYCKLHECYLEPKDVAEKRCNWKKCKYKEEIKEEGGMR